jgi:hypothetical protein
VTAQGARAKALDPFELPIEIRIVAEANTKADLEHALVGFDQQLGGCPDAQFIQIRSHGASGGSFEEAAKGCLVHVEANRKFGEVNLITEVLIQIVANCVDPLLVSTTAGRFHLQRRQNARIAFAGEIRECRQ